MSWQRLTPYEQCEHLEVIIIEKYPQRDNVANIPEMIGLQLYRGYCPECWTVLYRTFKGYTETNNALKYQGKVYKTYKK